MKVGKLFVFFTVIFICVSILCGYTIIRSKSYNKVLVNKIIYIDPGHGGKDNGASFYGVLEDEINLKISGFIIEMLMDNGGYVLTSRTSDYDLSSVYDKNKKRSDLLKRVNLINSSKADLFISVHLNSYSSSNVKGGQVFFQNSNSSENLAQFIQNNLNELSNDDKQIKRGNYYILNNTGVIGVLIECGFLSNGEERNNLLKESYQRKIASKIVKGIVEYFNNLSN